MYRANKISHTKKHYGHLYNDNSALAAFKSVKPPRSWTAGRTQRLISTVWSSPIIAFHLSVSADATPIEIEFENPNEK